MPKLYTPRESRGIQLSKIHLFAGFLTPIFPAMVLKSGLEPILQQRNSTIECLCP